MTDANLVQCRICKRGTARELNPRVSGAIGVLQSCPNCGRWQGRLDDIGPELSDPANASLMPYLAAHIRQANTAGQQTVELTGENWRDFAEAHASTPITRKLDGLLRWFESSSGYPGEFVTLLPGLAPLLDAANEPEVGFLAETLARQGALYDNAPRFQITAEGWTRLQPPASGGKPGTCFVAMSFDHSLDAAFSDGIHAAVQTDCGFFANRVDKIPHNDNITDRIIAGIRSAQFVVTDFTLQKHGVYYEAGFAEGLGRKVVRTCREDDFKNVHFDTNHFFHVLWATPADLRSKLADHVRATIGTWGTR